ncbi:MAG: BsuPI-related putative proteinase inhibitor [Verrucomicrobiota bacterium]
MKAILPPLAALAVLTLPLCAEEAASGKASGGAWSAIKGAWSTVATPTASALKSTTQAITGIFSQSEKKKAPLLLDVVCTPNPVSPSKNQRLEVLVKLHNNSKNTQMLEFATTQRASAVLRDGAGKIVARSSDGLQFTDDTAIVTVSPGERLEYTLSLSTQALATGKTYSLDVAITGQKGLSGTLPITVK